MRTILWWAGFTLLAAEAYTQNTAPEPAHKTMVLTGCLQSGSSPSLFKLTNASSSTAAGSTGQPIPLPSAARGTSGLTSEFELTTAGSQLQIDEQKIDLREHVGHRVEINARPTAPSPPVTPKPGDPAATKAPAEDKPIERVTVVALKHIAAVCP
jgi:hypothetical protein